MRFFRQIALLVVVCLGTSFVCYADVAPEPGYKRISLKLIVEANEDLPDYRFFIKSGADLKEIRLNKGEPVKIEPLGGGAYYRNGTLLAVPAKGLQGLSESAVDAKLQQAVYDGKIPGTLELVKHSFAREVPDAEAGGWKDPVYRIKPDGQAGLKAVHVSGGANESKIHNAASSGMAFWRSAAAAVVAGIFLLFGIAMLGILYFRKSAKTP